LTWERELLGLYISAHPLDNYDKYFEEQTIPLSHIKPEVDGKKATIGGIISTVRTIVTKSGSKMAFVGIEDKTDEAEIIVFPNLYEQFGAKLIQDAVVRATGKVSARDRDGNLGTEAKMIADDIQFVTDQELNEYESTGRKMSAPKASRVQATRVSAKKIDSDSRVNNVAASISSQTTDRVLVETEVVKKVYIHIKDPDDHDALFALKQTCSSFLGNVDIVLVLGAEKKSAIKLPFKVDGSDALIGALVKILGEDAVVLK
jgi:DNA polymerase-3 subunit alpha